MLLKLRFVDSYNVWPLINYVDNIGSQTGITLLVKDGENIKNIVIIYQWSISGQE